MSNGTSTVTQTGDIPKALEDFYLGKDTPEGRRQGLIERGVAEIFPGNYTGADAFASRYANVVDAQGNSLLGAGSIAGMSPYQTMVGERLAGMQTPGAFGTAEAFGDACIAVAGDFDAATLADAVEQTLTDIRLHASMKAACARVARTYDMHHHLPRTVAAIRESLPKNR
jgi:hypothetical protein